MRLAIILPAEVSRKTNSIKDFSRNYVFSLCGVVVRCSRVEPIVPGSSPAELFFSFFLFFSVFCVVVFYKYLAKLGYLKYSNAAAHSVDTGIS